MTDPLHQGYSDSGQVRRFLRHRAFYHIPPQAAQVRQSSLETSQRPVFSRDLPTNGGWGYKWDTSSDVWIENMQLPLRPQFWDSNVDGINNSSQNNGVGIERQACKRTVAYIFSFKWILTITLQSRYCFYAQLIIDEETEAQRAWALAVKAQKLIKKLGLQVDLWGKHSNLKENIGQSHRQIKKEEKGT